MRPRLRSFVRAAALLVSLVAWATVPQSALAHGIHIAGSQNEIIALLIPVLIFVIVTGGGVLLVHLYFRRDPRTKEDEL